MTNNNLPSISIDSCVFVSALGKPDAYTNSSKKFFSTLPSNYPVLISIMATAEIIVVLNRQNPQSTQKTLDHLVQFPTVTLDENLLKQSAKYLRHSSLKTSDFLIAATSALHHAILVTWDKLLLSSANKICKTITPAQFISRSTV